MKSKITLILLLCMSLGLSAQSVTIEGDPYGGNPYATIADAIAASTNASDVILISGTFTETVSISKSLTLRGSDPTTDIIQAAATASSDGTGSNVINVVRAADTDVLNVTIENLTIRHGNADSNTNGGGINVDKVTDIITLRNLIIENNHTEKNGGGISLAGSNALITECTVRNNTAALDGGAIIAVPNNGAAINSVVEISRTLIDSNDGRNGGGIYINGNNNFGNDFTIDVNVINSTISNNNSTSASSAAGGGGIWSKTAQLTTASAGVGNVNLKLIHATLYNNLHTSAVKNGLRFTGPSGVTTNFSAFNSIIITADDVSQKAINFTNTNTTAIVNCILGGLEGAGPYLSIIDDANSNNSKGKTDTFAGISGTLTDEGGRTQVLAITEGSNSDDYCTAAVTGETIPNTDQRGYDREGTYDAGAYEFGGVLSTSDQLMANLNVKVYPNPASGIVNISGLDRIEKITIYSVIGAVEKVIENDRSFDVSNLSSGIHLMVIKSTQGTVSKRLIIQ